MANVSNTSNTFWIP